jgi:hypothetical protein
MRSPQRYDCHNNLFFDSSSGRYVATTRDGFSGDPGRTIGIALSRPDELSFDNGTAPIETLYGDAGAQLYSQASLISDWAACCMQLALSCVRRPTCYAAW